MPRDCHSVADPNSYSPRTSSNRGEDHVPRARDVGDTAITSKEAFFRSMGLQMKGYQYGYTTLDGVHRTKKINVPCEVKLRDCSVVVPGAICRLCGKYFKCVTDVNAHATSRHRHYPTDDVVVSSELCCATDSSQAWEASPKPAEQATIPAGKSPGTKLSGKLRLTLRIGAEVVARRAMKRKHLRIHTVTDIATQTESTHRVEELIMRKCESSAPRIDLPVLDNSPCQCCTSSMHVVNSTNQYLAGNIVVSKDTDCEASATNKGSSDLDRLAESCASSTGEKVNGVSLSNVTQNVEQNDTTAGMFCFRDGNPDELSTLHYLSPVSDLNDNSWVTSYNSIRNDNAGIVSDDSGILSEQTVQSPEKDINANVKPREKPFEQQSLQNSGATSPVIVPIIIPILVSNNDTPPANKIQHRPPTHSQQRNPTPPSVAEWNADDEVQEVLRIIRGQAISEDINHESPNRSEQEMLLRDAIRDMLQMEEQGWHLLERGDTVELARKRRRAAGKSDTRNGNANDDSGRRKKRAPAQPSFDGNVIRSVANENYVSSTRELFAKVQKSSQSRVCITDSVKENLMMFNSNINVPSEVLHRYGINYYNEPFEINNNTETVQGSVNRFLVPCSGGTENRGNRPTVIDLVNDTDE